MPIKSPQDPRPDDLPEHQRAGDEPNPGGEAPVMPPALAIATSREFAGSAH